MALLVRVPWLIRLMDSLIRLMSKRNSAYNIKICVYICIWSIISFFLNGIRANQMGFEQVFDNLTFKRIIALRKKIQSVVNYLFNYCFFFWMNAF